MSDEYKVDTITRLKAKLHVTLIDLMDILSKLIEEAYEKGEGSTR